MSVFDTVKRFAQELFTLTKKVDKNTEDIDELRRNLTALVNFSQKVASVVKYERTKAEFVEKRADDKYEKLVLQLKVELYELERRLHVSATGTDKPRTLADNDDSGSATELPSSEP